MSDGFLKKALSSVWEFEGGGAAASEAGTPPSSKSKPVGAKAAVAAVEMPSMGAVPEIDAWDAARIYGNGGVAPGPAGKLSKFLGSIAGLPKDAATAAIKAFADADGSWTEEDALRDAAARLQALDGYAELLSAWALNMKASCAEAVDATLIKIQERTASLEAEIDRLRAELEVLAQQDREARQIQEAREHEIDNRMLATQGRLALERTAMNRVLKAFEKGA